MSDMIQINIQAILSEVSQKKILADIDIIRGKINGDPLILKVETNSEALNALTSKMKSLTSEVSNPIKLNLDASGIDKVTEKMKVFTDKNGNAVEMLSVKTKEFTNNLGLGVKETQTFNTALGKSGDYSKILADHVKTYTDNTKSATIAAEKLLITQEKLKASMSGLGSMPISAKPLATNATNLVEGLNPNSSAMELEKARLAVNALIAAHKELLATQSLEGQQSQAIAQTTAKYNQLFSEIRAGASSVKLTEEQMALLQEKLSTISIGNQAFTQLEELKALMTSMRSETNIQFVTDRDIENTRLENIELQRQIALFQERNQLALRNIQSQFGSLAQTPAVQSQVSSITASSGSLSNATDVEAFRAQSAEVTTATNNMRAGLNEARASSNNFGNDLLRDSVKMLEWTVVGGALFGSLSLIKKGLQDVISMNSTLGTLSITMNTTSQGLQDMSKQIQEVAISTGSSTQAVAEAVKVYANYGETTESIMAKTKSAIMLSNVSGLDTKQVTDSIHAILNEYNMGTVDVEKDSQHIADSLVAISKNMAVDFGQGIDEITKGIQVVGTVANEVGKQSSDQTEATIGAIVEKTRLGGEQVGNAMKTIISRIYKSTTIDPNVTNEDLSKTSATLDQLGVSVMDATGAYRNLNDIFADINKAENGMTDSQKQNIAFQASGIRQANIFAVAIDTVGRSQDLTNAAMSSSGELYNANAKYMETTSAKLKVLGSTINSMWQNTIDSNFISSLVSGVASLVSTFGNLKTVLALVVTGFAIFKGTEILNFFKSLTLYTSLSSFSFIQAQASLEGLSLAEIGVMTTTQGLGFAFRSLWATISKNPIGFIATAIAAVVVVMDIFGQKAGEVAQQQKELIDTYKQQQTEVTSLIQTYKDNAELAKTDESAKTKLIETEKKLKDIFGESAASLDLQSGSIDANIAKLEKLDTAQQNAFISKQKAFAEDAKNALNTSSQYSAGGLAKQDFEGTPEAAIAYYTKLRDEINQDLHRATSLTGKNSTDTIEESKQLSTMIDTLNGKVTGYKNTILTLDAAYKIVVQNSIGGLDKLGETQKTVFDNVKNKMTFTNEDQYKKNLLAVIDILSKWDGKNIDDLNNKLHKVDSTLPAIAKDATTATTAINAFATSVKTLQTTMATSSTNIAEVQSVLDDYDKTGKFNIDTLVKLGEKHSELIPVLGNEKATHQTLIDIIKAEQNASKEAYANMLMGSEDFYTKSVKNNADLINFFQVNYGVDLGNWKSLASAKEQVDLALSSKLSSIWSKYTDGQMTLNKGGQLKEGLDVTEGTGEIYDTKTGKVVGNVKTQMDQYYSLLNQAKTKFDNITMQGAKASGIDFSGIGMSASIDANKKAAEAAQKAAESAQKAAEKLENVTGPFADQIRVAASKTGISATLLDAVIKAESGFNPNAKSPSGAMGLMQLMPSTARSLGVSNAYDPAQNIMGGATYLKQMLDKFGGDTSKALAAYNAGPGAVTKYGGIPPYKETQNYVAKILADFNNRKSNQTAVDQIGQQTEIIPETPDYKDATDALIKETTATVALYKAKTDIVAKDAELAKNAGNYSLALEKTTEQIRGNNKQLSELYVTRSKINAMKDSSMVSAVSDTSSWFTTGNEQSAQYINQYNAQTAETQKIMELQFTTLQKLRNAWVENDTAIKSAKEATNALRDAYIALGLEQVDQAKSAKNYTLALSLANTLYKSQEQQLNSLATAMARINAEKDKFTQNGQWFTTDNEMSTAFIDQYRASSVAVQKTMSDQFFSLQALRKAWVVNTEDVKSTRSEIDKLRLSLILIKTEEIDLAKTNKDYGLAMSKTNEIIQIQATRLSDLYAAQKIVNDEKDKHVQNAQWFNADNSSSDAYYAEWIKQSPTVQANMDIEFNKLRALRIAWTENSNAIKEVISAEAQLQNDLRTLRGTVADDAISALKASIQMEKDLKLKSLDEEQKAADTAHEKTLKRYEEEYSAIEKVANEKIKSIDLEKSNNDYDKQLSTAQKEAQAIQSKINIGSLDTSVEGKARNEELIAKLADKNIEISDMQSNRNIDLRKTSITDQLATDKTLSDAKIKTETETYDAEKVIRDQTKVDVAYEYDTRLNDETTFAKLRLDIVNGNTTDIENAIKASVSNISQYTADELKKLGVTATEVASTVLNATTAIGDSKTVTKQNVYGNEADIAEAKKVANADKFNFITVKNDASQSELGSIVLGGTGAISDAKSGQGQRVAGIDADATFKLFEAIAKGIDAGGTSTKTNVYGNAIDIAGAKTTSSAGNYNFITVQGSAPNAEKGSYVLGGSGVISNSGLGTVIAGNDATETRNQFENATNGSVPRRNVYGVAGDIALAKTVSNKDKFNFITVVDDASQAGINDFVIGGTSVVKSAGEAERISGIDKESTFALFKAKTASMDVGGLTPSWGTEGKLAILHQNELVSSKIDTSSILKAMDISKMILSNFKLPDFSKLKLSGMGNILNQNNAITFNVSGANGLTKSDMQKASDYVFSQISNGMKANFGTR